MAKFSNAQMELMIETLKRFLPQKNRIGYVAARNTRLLATETTEYFKIRNEMIVKYGKPEVDEDGNELGSVSISIGSREHKQFNEAMKEYASIEHEVSIMKLKYSEVIGILSGEEILSIDWMLEDDTEEET